MNSNEKLISQLENFRPCDWGKYSMYFYVKIKRELPPLCQRCRKVLIFFDEKEEYENFKRKCKKRDISFNFIPPMVSVKKEEFRYKTIPIKGGRGIEIVIYVQEKTEKESEEKATHLHRTFLSLIKNKGIKGRVFIRKAGRYWQDMFPELFGKNFHNYKPFYKDYYEFRIKADKLSEEKIRKEVKKEISELKSLYELFEVSQE